MIRRLIGIFGFMRFQNRLNFIKNRILDEFRNFIIFQMISNQVCVLEASC